MEVLVSCYGNYYNSVAISHWAAPLLWACYCHIHTNIPCGLAAIKSTLTSCGLAAIKSTLTSRGLAAIKPTVTSRGLAAIKPTVTSPVGLQLLSPHSV